MEDNGHESETGVANRPRRGTVGVQYHRANNDLQWRLPLNFFVALGIAFPEFLALEWKDQQRLEL